MNRKFTLCFFFIFSAFLVLFVLPSLVATWKSYEFSSTGRIVNDQKEYEGIYASALDHNVMPYKLSLIESRRPDIVAIGSSRAMQFRGEYFRDGISFVNAGGAAASIEDMSAFTREMLEVHKPNAIILVIDFWWFNPNRTNPVRPLEGTVEDFDIPKAIRFWEEVKGRGIPEATGWLGYGPLISSDSGLSVLGLSAFYNSSGYRPDGSRLYFDLLFGDRPSPDVHFENTLSRMSKGVNRFEHADRVNMEGFAILQELVEDLANEGIQVAVITPPLAPAIINAMNDMPDHYNYVNEFLSIVEKNGWSNYHDPKEIGSDECEFIDGFHGGDVTYHRILSDMGRRIEWMPPFLDAEMSERVINQNQGRAYTQTRLHSELANLRERDFLELGCEKSP